MGKKTIEKKYILLIIAVIVIVILVILSYGLKKKKNLNVVESIIKDSIVSVENVIFYPFRYTIDNATGLICKVVSCTNYTSVVKLITTSDTDNKISVSIVSEGEKLNGLINGYDYKSKLLEVEGISNTKTVRVGDIVYTSGLGGVFPSGILIGTVESITTDSYDLSKIINVKPSADFEDLNYVSVLKRKENNE